MSPLPKLSIRLFGPPEILLDGVPIQPLQPKRQALLFYLAAAGERYLRSTVASVFWSNLSDNRALTNLRKPVQQFGQLFPHHFYADNQSIHLKETPNLWVDVREFEQKLATYKSTGDVEALRRAVDLYANDFLSGLYVRNTPEFESWQFNKRANLREKMIHALQNLNHHAISTNDLVAAIQFVRRIVTLEPWREETHLQLMQLLVQNDQRQEALRQYEICREAVREELDVELGEEVEAFYRAIKSDAQGGTKQPRSLA